MRLSCLKHNNLLQTNIDFKVFRDFLIETKHSKAMINPEETQPFFLNVWGNHSNTVNELKEDSTPTNRKSLMQQ